MWASLANKSKIRRNIKGVAMTINREKLANMTNEELADILAKCSDIKVCNYCIYNNNCSREIQCYEGILKWLNQESDGE